MDPTHTSQSVLELEPTPSQEALRRIVEVFRTGYEAAADLRRTADGMTPVQLQLQLQAIEQSMLSQITRICDGYQGQETAVPRH